MGWGGIRKGGRCDPPSANLGIVTVPYQARTYNNEFFQLGDDGLHGWILPAVKGDASDDWDGEGYYY